MTWVLWPGLEKSDKNIISMQKPSSWVYFYLGVRRTGLTMVMMNLGEPEGNIKALFNDPVRFLYRLTVIKRGMVCPSGFLILWIDSSGTINREYLWMYNTVVLQALRPVPEWQMLACRSVLCVLNQSKCSMGSALVCVCSYVKRFYHPE